MDACLFNTPAHDGIDILPVRLSIRRDVQLMCSGCRAHVSASTYLRVVDRRMTDLPVITERRRIPRPAWFRHLTSRDETGALSA